MAKPDQIANMTENPGSPSEPHHDKYWRLNTYQSTTRYVLNEQLDKKGLGLRSDIRKAEIVEVQQRLDRGLLHYEDKRITNDDLKRFIQDRRLEKPVSSTRKAMISVLMGADEARRFDKFVDLPPELRERIFHFHISSLPDRLFCPTQPPVTRVCKLLRKEALPIFHKLTTFELRFYFVNDQYRVGDDMSKAALRPCLQTSRFLDSMRSSGATKVRLDRVMMYVMEGSMRDMLLSTGEVVAWCAYQVARTAQEIRFAGKTVRRGKNMMSKLGHRQKNYIASKPGKIKFNLDDVYKLRWRLERAFFSTYRKFGDR